MCFLSDPYVNIEHVVFDVVPTEKPTDSPTGGGGESTNLTSNMFIVSDLKWRYFSFTWGSIEDEEEEEQEEDPS